MSRRARICGAEYEQLISDSGIRWACGDGGLSERRCAAGWTLCAGWRGAESELGILTLRKRAV